MMIKGGIRIGGLGISGYDADAAAYFDRAGVTDTTAKTQINAFVKGLKDLSLYNSIVSWPLRSAQNSGTGTTAYSLGGLQTSNATLTGAGWTSEGVSFSSAAQYMTSDLTNIAKDATLFVSAKGDGSNYNTFPWIGGVYHPTAYNISSLALGNSNSGGGAALGVGIVGGYQKTSDITSGLSGASSFVALSGSYKRNTVFNVRNLSTSTVGTQVTYLADDATTLTKMVLNGRWTGTSGEQANPMTSSFFAIITPNCDSVISSFHTLYKNTLGTGLGLP
jgi:hypothetical protein